MISFDLECAIIITTFHLWRDQVIQLTIVIAYLACVFPKVSLVMLDFQADCKFKTAAHKWNNTAFFCLAVGYLKKFSRFWDELFHKLVSHKVLSVFVAKPSSTWLLTHLLTPASLRGQLRQVS